MRTDKENHDRLVKKLTMFLCNDRDAIALCLNIIFVSHLWDDLIDKDCQRSDSDISEAFRIMLVDIPSNPFYLRFGHLLRPLIQNSILQWLDANVLERSTEHDKNMAYMLRAAPLQILNYCAYLIGGQAWYDEVGPDMRRMYEEELNDFMKEFSDA